MHGVICFLSVTADWESLFESVNHFDHNWDSFLCPSADQCLFQWITLASVWFSESVWPVFESVNHFGQCLIQYSVNQWPQLQRVRICIIESFWLWPRFTSQSCQRFYVWISESFWLKLRFALLPFITWSRWIICVTTSILSSVVHPLRDWIILVMNTIKIHSSVLQ